MTLHQYFGPFKSRIFDFINAVFRRFRHEEIQIYRRANSVALKQNELGVSVEELSRKMGISEATFYNWKQKYGGLGSSELRRLKQLEEENSKLKRLVAIHRGM